MALLPANVFQPPTPSLTFLIPPASYSQWVLRFLLLGFTLLSFPLIIVLVPLSIILPLKYAPIPLHPHNLPPHRSFIWACIRGWHVYCLGGLIWAITGSGSAPDHQVGLARKMTKGSQNIIEFIARITGSEGNGGGLSVTEEIIEPFSRELCVGVLDLDDLDRQSLVGFRLDSIPRKGSTTITPKAKKATLWLSGGGYVTGYPLVDPPLFSIARNLPLGSYTFFAPAVRRCLSLDRAFPIPLLDALAGYAHLRKIGYEAKDIVIMGNSAGSGLSWSLIAYLAILKDARKGDLGIPGEVVMISPWLSLPPGPAPKFPDLIDEPQLLGAARCYLARFPIVPSRPDPFQSDWYLWEEAIRIRISGAIKWMKSWVLRHDKEHRTKTIEKVEEKALGAKRTLERIPKTHIGWIDESTFTSLSSHHPLISPSTDISSPFVKHTLEILAHHGTKVFMYVGTAEWFYDSAIRFTREAEKAGIEVVYAEERGGYHVEGCVMPPDLGGPAARLQSKLIQFLCHGT